MGECRHDERPPSARIGSIESGDADGDHLACDCESDPACACFTGPGDGVLPGCDGDDLGPDDDSDLGDFSRLQLNFTPGRAGYDAFRRRRDR